MRVRAAHERRGERVVPEVVEVAAVAGQQPRVLLALDRLRRTCFVVMTVGLPGSSRPISAARSTDLDDVLVAGAAAQVAADRLAGLLLRRVGVLLAGRR